MALKPLEPMPKVALSTGWDLVATEAGRSSKGLQASVHLLNGESQACQTLVLGDVAAQQALAAAFADIAALDAPTITRALPRLIAAIEGVLREMEATRTTAKEDDDLPGHPLTFEELEPWPAPVDGAELLTTLAETFATYSVLPPGGKDLLALWTFHTYVLNAAHCTPILGITSPQKRCGKTTVLSVLAALTYKPLPASNISPAAVFRTIEQCMPTLLVDEADTFLRDNDELRGVLNSGHTRDMAYVIRTVGEHHEPRTFSTWCPKAVALIGELPETLHDRAIQLPMQRRTTEEPVQKWRAERREALMDLRRQCARWAQDALPTLRNATPALPATLHDRAADNWAPLVAIAEQAGGEWPARTMKALQALTDGTHEDDAAGVMLLQDMARLFEEQHADRLLSSALAHALAAIEERPWPEWSNGKPITARQIARILVPFGIRPKTVRLGTEVAKGYLLTDCHDAFSRYLGIASVTPSHTSNDAVFRENRSVTGHKDVTDEKSQNTASHKGSNGVTDEKGGASPVQEKVPGPGRHAPAPASKYRCPQCKEFLGEVGGSNGERLYCAGCKKFYRVPQGKG